MVCYDKNNCTKQVDENSKRKILAYDNSMMGTRMWFSHTTDNVETHQHENEQFTVIIKGKFKFIKGTETYILETGDSITFEPNVPHGCIVLENDSELIDVFTPFRSDFLD